VPAARLTRRLTGIALKIYMVKVSYQQKPYRLPHHDSKTTNNIRRKKSSPPSPSCPRSTNQPCRERATVPDLPNRSGIMSPGG